jgi:hypothetical protein
MRNSPQKTESAEKTLDVAYFREPYQFPGISLNRINKLEKTQAPTRPGMILPINPISKPMRAMSIVPKRPPENAPVRLINHVAQNIRKVKSLLLRLITRTGMKAQAT